MLDINSVLVVIEPNQVQQPALSRGIDLVNRTGAKLMVLLSVYHPSYDLTTMLSTHEREEFRAEYIADQYQALSNLMSNYSLPEQTITAINWHKRVYDSIVETAKDESADIIIKSTKHDAVVTSLVFTPLDWHLMRKSPIPVLLVKNNDWPTYDDILTAVNTGDEDLTHTDLNDKLTSTAEDFAKLFSSNLHLVNAYPRISFPITSPSYVFNSLNVAIKNHHKQAMNRFGLRHRIDNNNLYVKEGLPEKVIPNVASNIDADLLIIGSGSKSSLTGFTLGNTAEHLMNNIECDVLTIKPDGFVSPKH
ncbi:MAG: Universal stress protein E [Glaciecola sp. HTCC2999]|jgi:universal stress protein E|nr:MAG: Universal stress protein E [Glaciecola sp. HTCC2999]